MMLQYVH